MQTLAGLWIPRPNLDLPVLAAGTLYSANMQINASGEKVAFVFRAPKTGTLERVGLRTFNVTTWQNLRVSFQNVSATDGHPDGTQDQFRDITTSPGANSWVETGIMSSDGTDGGVKRAVTRGELLALVIEFVSTVGDVTITSFFTTAAALANPYQFSYLDMFAGSWAKTTSSIPIFSLKYDDGTYPYWPQSYPTKELANQDFGNASTPDEVALRFLLPVAARLGGAWISVDPGAGCDVVLYQGTTALATIAIDPDQTGSANVASGVVWFPAELTLEANTEYLLAVKPTTATAVRLVVWEVATAAMLEQMDGGTAFHYAQRTDAGAWAYTTTKRPAMALLLTGINAGGVAGIIGG